MRLLRAFGSRLLGAFGLGRRDRDIADELEMHRELLADDYRRAGLSDAEARRAAAAAIGGLSSAAGAYRDRRGLPVLESAGRDVVYALRSLSRSRALSISMVLVLGLGIGFSTAVATVFRAIVWQDLPVSDPSRVVKLALALEGKVDRQVLGNLSAFSYPELAAYRQVSHTLDGLAGVREERLTWLGASGAEPVSGALVTGDYFRTLRVVPARGRVLSDADAREAVAVVSYQFWQTALSGRPDVVGTSLVLDRSPYVVVGVADEHFTGTEVNALAVWIPLEIGETLRGQPDLLTRSNVSWLEAVGRLAPGESLTSAGAEAAAIAARMGLDYPGRRTTISVVRASRVDAIFQSHERNMLLGVGAALAGAVLILLLICGSNVAALLLARGATRQKEIALRVALGAGRSRIVQQLAAEIAVVAVASAALGVAIATASLRLAAGFLPLGGVLTSLWPDASMMGFAAGFAAIVAGVFGLAPARQALRVDCLSGIKGESGQADARVPAMRLRQALIAVQVAVSLVLLIGAALFGRAVAGTLEIDPGYRTAGLYFVEHDADFLPGQTRQPDAQRLVDEVTRALDGQPGVTVGMAMMAPFYGRGESTVRTDAAPDLVRVNFGKVDPGFFQALGLAPVTGRMFSAGEPDAVVVNARLARQFWHDEGAAVGHLLRIPGRRETGAGGMRAMRVVGVVPTIRTVELGEPDGPIYYEPMTKTDGDGRFIIVRAPEGVDVAALVTRAVRAADPRAYVKVSSLADRMTAMTGPARLGASIAGLIGLLALLVAAVGIHGIVAHAVTSRTREIGVRMALGAARGDVLRLLVTSSLRGVVIGALAGGLCVMVVAMSLARPLRTALFGLAPLDPLAWGAAIGVLCAMTVVAAYLPARRALGVRPLDALRYDA